jgi:hypothetical protein
MRPVWASGHARRQCPCWHRLPPGNHSETKHDDLQGEEIFQELLAGFGQDGFGVELDAFEFVAAMAEAHNDAVVGFGGDG